MYKCIPYQVVAGCERLASISSLRKIADIRMYLIRGCISSRTGTAYNMKQTTHTSNFRVYLEPSILSTICANICNFLAGIVQSPLKLISRQPSTSNTLLLAEVMCVHQYKTVKVTYKLLLAGNLKAGSFPYPGSRYSSSNFSGTLNLIT